MPEPEIAKGTAMRRVLLISNKVFHYRVSNYNYFARRFRELGWDFVVRANELEKSNPYPPQFDFRVVPFDFALYRREVEDLKPDVVLLFLHLKDKITFPILHWLKLKGIPVVYWNKGVNLEVRNPLIRNLPFYYVHALSNAIVLYSPKETKDIRPANRHKVFVANNTVNFEAFPAITAGKEELKREFNIPFKKVVLFVGRMRSVKKVEHLISTFNEIDDPDCGCVIVGDPMQYDLPSLIKKKNVIHLGEIHDPDGVKISKIFKLSDLFVIPGDVGLGMNQAFYWGLPVVTEAGLQPPEIHYLTEGRNGFIVPENDTAALKEKMLLLLRDDALRARFSAAARQDIMREASIERMFSGFRDCVTALTNPKSPLCARRYRRQGEKLKS
jgi:glycosyltransferase involved in cell wall biosynthesis